MDLYALEPSYTIGGLQPVERAIYYQGLLLLRQKVSGRNGSIDYLEKTVNRHKIKFINFKISFQIEVKINRNIMVMIAS